MNTVVIIKTNSGINTDWEQSVIEKSTSELSIIKAAICFIIAINITITKTITGLYPILKKIKAMGSDNSVIKLHIT